MVVLTTQLAMAIPARQRAASRSPSARTTGRPQRLQVSAAAAEFTQTDTIVLGVLLVGAGGMMTVRPGG